MKSIRELREYQYDYHSRLYPYVNDWRKCPYTFLKARFYMEASAVLVYLLLRTRITPNAVTVTYALTGIVGAVLIGSGLPGCVVAGAVIYFIKGVLDWSDGHLARITGRTSASGAVLDPYASSLGGVVLQMALGAYSYSRTGNIMFLYLLPLIPLFTLGRIHLFAYSELFKNMNSESQIRAFLCRDKKEDAPFRGMADGGGMAARGYSLLNRVLDNRARTVDLICLLLVFEQVSRYSIVWLVFAGFLVKDVLLFLCSLYAVLKGDWVGSSLRDKYGEVFETYERIKK
ncbi:MAG: CDP-alcohol phosphatidyltransferase family protein [Candidatus Omnitrophica bacterium]|nr:CDP-alcohol phosphatidyltransferase family protein [Candidatus Omnitrophota bacterium]